MTAEYLAVGWIGVNLIGLHILMWTLIACGPKSWRSDWDWNKDCLR